MEFEIGLRKWAVLKVGLLSPAGESMKSSLISIMGSFIIMDNLQKAETFLLKNTTMEKTQTVEKCDDNETTLTNKDEPFCYLFQKMVAFTTLAEV
jgi:hypothetical protein